MRKSIPIFSLAVASIFSPVIAQDRPKSNETTCIAGKIDGHNVEVVKQKRHYWIHELKPGDVLIIDSLDSGTVYTTEGEMKKGPMGYGVTLTPKELEGYRAKCGFKVAVKPAKTAEHN